MLIDRCGANDAAASARGGDTDTEDLHGSSPRSCTDKNMLLTQWCGVVATCGVHTAGKLAKYITRD